MGYGRCSRSTPLLCTPLAGGDASPCRYTMWQEQLRKYCQITAAQLSEVISHLVQLPSIVAAQYRLRGSDAVYAAVAMRFSSALVTLDREQKKRVAEAVDTMLPEEALAEIG